MPVSIFVARSPTSSIIIIIIIIIVGVIVVVIDASRLGTAQAALPSLDPSRSTVRARGMRASV